MQRDVGIAQMVLPWRHDDFNADTECGGWAFLTTGHLHVEAYDGGRYTSVDPGYRPDHRAVIGAYWAKQRHRHGEINDVACSIGEARRGGVVVKQA